ncbi:MAG: DUF4199 domain-containing protein [Bacteroidota bacterium]
MLKHPSLRYGLLSGALLCIVFFTPYFLWGSRFDLDLGEALGYAGILIAMVVGIFPAIRYRREKEFGGKIGFSAAFRTGLLATLVSAMMVYLAVYLFWELNGSEWLTRNYYHKVEKIHQQYSTDSLTIQQKVAELSEDMKRNRQDHLDSNSQASIIFFIILLFGSVLSLAAATVQRKQ